MSLNSVVATAQQILNRDDVSNTQMQAFVLQAITRITRDLRLPCQERSLLITPDGPMTFFNCPLDLIQPIDLLVLNTSAPTLTWRPLKHKPYRQLVMANPYDYPWAYARSQTQYWITGPVPAGWQVNFLYYGNYSPFAADGSNDNEITASNPDLVVYAALRYAGDSIEHPATASWEATYQTIKQAVELMAVDLDAEGGPAQIEPIHQFDN